jgi:hypothetical protein
VHEAGVSEAGSQGWPHNSVVRTSSLPGECLILRAEGYAGPNSNESSSK